jgi:hemolysin III
MPVRKPDRERDAKLHGMTGRAHASRYSLAEEIANSVSHGIGALLAVVGLVVLTVFAALRGNVWHIVGCSIFGVALVLVYTTSTLYHGIQHPRAKAVFRALDHSAIFILIAGTYTPFALVSLRGPWGWSLFGVIWGLAVLGIILQTGVLRRGTAASVFLYVGMGWVAVIVIKPLLDAVPPGGIMLLLIGGVAYTAGTGFYLWRRLPYHHALWHGFVLLGSVSHFFAVLLYVIPSVA